MAIYGDGKHNENMKYVSPNFEITDKATYQTICWTIETDDDVCHVTMQEYDYDVNWKIYSDEQGEIDLDSDLAQELISICIADLNK